jgi:hypothetical protein
MKVRMVGTSSARSSLINRTSFKGFILLFATVAARAFGFAQTSIIRASSTAAAASATLLCSKNDNNNYDVQGDVQVYDNTFSPVACQVLHALAVDHSYQVNGETSFFLRPPWNEKPLTPLEHAIDSALTAMDAIAMNNTNSSINSTLSYLDENSKVPDNLPEPDRLVEYWSREEYMNIDAHVDIDEKGLPTGIEDADLVCGSHLVVPSSSHVMYLDVNVKGPTCVFPSKRVGWGLELEGITNDITTGSKAGVDLVIVPAVQGRILKFPGAAFHSVPCPNDRWLLDDEEQLQLQMMENLEQEDDDDDELYVYDDDDDDDDDDDGIEEEEIERSVLLFNTWPNDGPVPRDAYQNGSYWSTQGAMSEDEVAAVVEEWERDFWVNAKLIRCNSACDWRNQSIIANNGDKEDSQKQSQRQQQIRVGLMGEENRRVYPEKTALLNLPGDVHEFRGALEQETVVSHFRLHER